MMGFMVLLAIVAMIGHGAISLKVFLDSPWFSKPASRRLVIWSAFSVVFSGTIIWSILVNSIVPDPYMDEIFHIPQAQKYCRGKIFDWDDKLTTPPGLYLVPLATAPLLSKIFGTILPQVLCSPTVLRLQNAVCICLLFWVALNCRRKIERMHHTEQTDVKPLTFISHYSVHTALNIALFPVLFFFSGLYYTDVMSTLLVLVAFDNSLDRLSRKKSSLNNSIWTVFLGTATLFMRQTNIFWIVVFLGGIEAVHSLKMLLPTITLPEPGFHDERDAIEFWVTRYAKGHLVDPHLDEVGSLDLIHCLFSIAIGVICKPSTVIRQIWPYMATLGLFVSFVIWNGGVVLGDKNNHIATIHLPQMLYIWPMFICFVLPLAIPTIIELGKWAVRARSASKSPGPTEASLKKQRELSKSPYPLYRLAARLATVPAWAWLIIHLVAAAFLATVVVTFNTIVHPFTLADNRHYMFYIFRYTIRRSLLVRWALVPIYIVCAWLCWSILRPCGDFIGDRLVTTSHYFPNCSRHCFGLPRKPAGPYWHRTLDRAVYTDPDALKQVPFHDLKVQHLEKDKHPAVETALSSTVIILFVATTLSLMTAPLVEPRYFILPFVFFRLLCPAWITHEHKNEGRDHPLPKNALKQYLWSVGKRLDVRLVLETFWYILINLVTMFIFLYYPFYWKQDDGITLDEEHPQRFIW
ncbi:DIE2/ALG10 family-domain-containing protein [Plectosphaerella plurivora]|uniref:Dol-P-Glc:Glc(2)Man(9)GlcNAc(2)-PP-Dol alpha-1,2-glucosyltransferase n=1 Tax=Plectosphaerella plurivora TaxID=936078 RepID=A0A9P8V4H0_9PEZI|nr:DIE2/ALG10 family-domain-containing protein [Plectosphaerella plurivora]